MGLSNFAGWPGVASLSSGALVSFLVALSFAAGLNVYATTVTLGLLARMHWVVLPHGLGPLENTWVIAAGAVLFGCEMFADKIPLVDLVWNFAQTFIRIPVAALLAFRATTQLSPGMQALVVLLSAVIAAIAHGGKTAARVAVTASPEPVSNVALSASGDVAAIALSWVATKHPLAAGMVAAGLLVVAIFAVRAIVRGVKRQVARVREWLGGDGRLRLRSE